MDLNWIALKVIFQGPKGQKKVKLGCFATFCQFSQKNGMINVFIFCVQFLGDDIDQLSIYGFDWIIQKVISKVRKVRFDQ